MIVLINTSFDKDISKIKDKIILSKVHRVITEIQKAEESTEIRNLKKLKGEHNYFRIRMGDYRIGIILKKKTVEFVRFLHRKDVYKYFP